MESLFHVLQRKLFPFTLQRQVPFPTPEGRGFIDSLISQVTSVPQLCSFLSLSDLCFPLSLSNFSHFLPQAYPDKQVYSVVWKEEELKSNWESEWRFPM